MGIMKILQHNFGAGSRTRKPADKVPFPTAYRGALQHEANRCTGCGSCAYVCSPAAITVDQSVPGEVTWEYNGVQCTFCGRCVQYCPTKAIQMEPHPTQMVENPEDLVIRHTVKYTNCSRCHKPFLPLPGAVLVEMYGDPLPADIAEIRGMCETCRNKVTTAKLKDAIRGERAKSASERNIRR